MQRLFTEHQLHRMCYNIVTDSRVSVEHSHLDNNLRETQHKIIVGLSIVA